MKFFNKRIIIFSVCVSIVYSFPLMLSNHLFIDDMGRNLYGYGWDVDGRFLSTFLMKILSIGRIITGIYPYSIVLSCIIMFLSGYILASQASNFTEKTNLLISSTMFFSPFLLENLSYRYDSLTMALSVLSCTIPFIFHKKEGKKYCIISVLCLLFTYLTYQPSIAVYPLCTVAIAASIAKEKINESIKFCAISLVYFFVATGLYFILIGIIGIKFYGHNVSISTSVDVILDRYSFIWHYITGSLNKVQSVLVIIALLTSLLSVIFSRSIRSLTGKCLIILLMIIAFPLSVSLAVMLTNTHLVARVFIGIPFLLILLLCIFSKHNEKSAKILSVIMGLSSLPMVSAYSTALDDQFNFEKNIVTNAFSSIDSTDKTITVEGSLPYITSVKTKIENFPVIGKIITITMKEGWPWGDEFLVSQGLTKQWQYVTGPRDINGKAKIILEKKCTMAKIKTSLYYNIYLKDDMILLDFNKTECM